jgi:hypothetical protein
MLTPEQLVSLLRQILAGRAFRRAAGEEAGTQTG